MRAQPCAMAAAWMNNISSTTLVLLGASFATAAISAALRRSKRLAIFQGVVLSIHSVSSAVNYFKVLPSPIFIYLNATVFISFLSLIRPSLKPNLWRVLISFPGSYYSSCTILWFLFTPISVCTLFGGLVY